MPASAGINLLFSVNKTQVTKSCGQIIPNNRQSLHEEFKSEIPSSPQEGVSQEKLKSVSR